MLNQLTEPTKEFSAYRQPSKAVFGAITVTSFGNVDADPIAQIRALV